jgi:hypothetical protein
MSRHGAARGEAGRGPTCARSWGRGSAGAARLEIPGGFAACTAGDHDTRNTVRRPPTLFSHHQPTVRAITKSSIAVLARMCTS